MHVVSFSSRLYTKQSIKCLQPIIVFNSNARAEVKRFWFVNTTHFNRWDEDNEDAYIRHHAQAYNIINSIRSESTQYEENGQKGNFPFRCYYSF